MKKIDKEPLFLYVDLFCGAGGTTTGIVKAILQGQHIAKVIACVNHDPIAIKSHWANHKDVKHFEEDIRTLDLTQLIALVKYWRAKYPNAKLVLWASLECTNFSKAKGGLPRDADSRTLADHLERYIQAINPDYVQIENVVEFMAWGPMRIKAKKRHISHTELCVIKQKKTGDLVYGWEPLSKKNGQDWMRWRKEICEMGYRDEWKELNSANFGAFTSRNRLFGVFAKGDLPITWPDATHAKTPSKMSMHGDLQKWKAVKEVLNFSDEGQSIFNRKKQLSDKTYERIYAGLIKFVAKGDTSFIQKHFSGKPDGKVTSINTAIGTLTTVCNQSLIQTAAFLGHYYSGGGQLSSIETACPTLRTKDGVQLFQPQYFLDKHFGSFPQNQSIETAAGSLMPNDKHRLVEATPFITSQNFNNKPTSIDDPMQVITANRKHHYLVNPSHGGNCTSTENPCPVVVARQDKAPLYLVQAEVGQVQVPIYDTDTPIMIQVKEFMAAFNLVDIKMRMLRVPELLEIQGFPTGYVLKGKQADQKKFIGNSVVPLVVQVWLEAMGNKLIDYTQKLAA